MSKCLTKNNLAEKKNGIVLSEGNPTLLYYMIGAEKTDSSDWRDDKTINIARNEHVVCIYARLDKFEYKGSRLGGGFILNRQHPLILGKALPLTNEER